MRILIKVLRGLGRALLVVAVMVAYAIAVLEKREELCARADESLDLITES